MKRALLTLGALCAILSTSPVNANTWEQWFRWAITTALRSGVDVKAPNWCPPGYAAFYEPSKRSITICPEATRRGDAYVAESLAHEATHAAQHCLGIRLGTNATTPIGAWLAATRGDSRLLNLAQQAIYAKGNDINASSRRNPNIYLAEAEAYALEDHPTEAIQLLAAACQ